MTETIVAKPVPQNVTTMVLSKKMLRNVLGFDEYGIEIQSIVPFGSPDGELRLLLVHPSFPGPLVRMGYDGTAIWPMSMTWEEILEHVLVWSGGEQYRTKPVV